MVEKKYDKDGRLYFPKPMDVVVWERINGHCPKCCFTCRNFSLYQIAKCAIAQPGAEVPYEFASDIPTSCVFWNQYDIGDRDNAQTEEEIPF